MQRAKKNAFFLLLLFVLEGKAQNIYFQFTNSTYAQYALADIGNITFAASNMNLNMKTGSAITLPINTIRSFNYTGYGANTGINSPSENVQQSEVSVYPNPGNGKVTITYNYMEPGQVTIELMAMNGELLNNIVQQNAAGNNNLTFSMSDKQGNDLPAGMYLCRISNSQNSITKKIIIN